MDEANKENQQLRKQNDEIPGLVRKLDAIKTLEDKVKDLRSQLAVKENVIHLANERLDNERDEKMAILDEQSKEETILKEKFEQMMIENEQLKVDIEKIKENAAQTELVMSERNRLLTDMDNDEIHQAYQKILRDKEALESENFMLKGLIKSAPVASMTHTRSFSNVSSVNIDDDYGYGSGKNTLELKRDEYNNNNGLPLTTTPPSSIAGDRDKVNKGNLNISDTNHSIESYQTFSE